MRLDPFTVGIIRDGLVAAAEESFIRFGRSSQSPIIYEVLDYAAGITDERGDLVAQANGVPGFLGTLSFAVKAVIEKFGGAGPKPGEGFSPGRGFAPGDLFITNDPYSGGGNHLSDVALIQPIFCGREIGGRSRAGSNGRGPRTKGARPVAFSVNKAHWTEVGGMAPGSWTTDSTEIYQEGLQFPVIRLGAGYTPDPALVDLIAANVRTPERTLGDLLAGIAALRIAERRVMEIAAKFGERVVRESMNTILDDGERSARAALSSLPRGTFHADELMDDDGLSDEPVRVQAKVTITGDEFVADFTGSSPQVRGPINCTRTRLHSACRSMFKSVTDPGAPLNDGWFRPLRVICPDGTVFTASRPAPVSTYWETGAYAVDLIWKALFPVLPGRLTAGHFLSICGTIISGVDERGERFILVEPQAGGWGAGADKDGESGLVAVGDGETYIMPVEVCENRYPLLVDRYAFAVTDRGKGRHRGGFGVVKDYRVLCGEGFVTATFGRHKYPPWGFEGGEEGSPNGVAVFPAGKECGSEWGSSNQWASGAAVWRGKLARYPLRRGDVVRLVTGTGGGFGPPRERDPELIRHDVENGFAPADRAAI